MSQKQTPQQMAAMVQELANRTVNATHMKALQEFLQVCLVPGEKAIEVGSAMLWLANVVKGEEARCAELKALLPQKDTEIKLAEAPAGPETPEAPEQPEQPQAPAPADCEVSGVELSKGSEVLQPA